MEQNNCFVTSSLGVQKLISQKKRKIEIKNDEKDWRVN